MITDHAKRITPNQRRRDFALIGALPPGAIAYTRTAGELENPPAQELELPVKPELRRELQMTGEERWTRQDTGIGLENRTFPR
jgi:hypothetical protein